MKEIQEIKSVTWTDNAESRVMARFIYADGTTEVLSIPRDDSNQHWQAVTQFWSVEQITEFTSGALEQAESRRLKAIARDREALDTKKASLLFNAKIEAFDVPEVVASPKELKSRIRKAKSVTEVAGVVAVCIMKAMERQNDQQS